MRGYSRKLMKWPTAARIMAMLAGGALAPSQVTTPVPARKATTPAKPAIPRPKPAAPAATLMTDEQKIIYALGLSISNSIQPFSLTPAELEIIKRALSDSAAGKPAEKLSDWGPKIGDLAKTRVTAASKAYFDKAAAAPGAVKTSSGMIYKPTTEGTGPSPKATDTVKVNYRGTRTDGMEFDSSYSRKEPATFALNGVIPCWTEGLQLMKVGGKATLVCPASLAYGEQGHPPTIPGGSTLIFDVELLSIEGAAK